jgi:hypothetical protein
MKLQVTNQNHLIRNSEYFHSQKDKISSQSAFVMKRRRIPAKKSGIVPEQASYRQFRYMYLYNSFDTPSIYTH